MTCSMMTIFVCLNPLPIQFCQRMKVVEVCNVGPPPSTTTTTTTQTSLPLTQFGSVWLRFPPTQRLFFYKTSEKATAILPNLKHSLSLTLQHYLPIAGKLTWPPGNKNPIIRYTEGDGGVSLTVAEADEDDFHRFTDEGNIVFQVEEFSQFLPELSSTRVEASAMAFQVTFFGGKGYSVGYSAHPAVVDGKSISIFIHAWATICRNILDNDLLEIEQDSITPTQDITDINNPAIYLNYWLDEDGPNNKSVMLHKPQSLPHHLLHKTFSLTPQVIDYIKRSIQIQSQVKFHVPLTTFAAVVAYIWVCLVKSKKQMIQEDDDEVYFGFLADARARLQPPLPSNYFGNCDAYRTLAIPFHDIVKEDGVAKAAKAIGEYVESLKDIVVLPGSSSEVSWNPELLISPKGLTTIIAGSVKFQAYSVNFGWGKPRKVVMTSMNRSGTFAISDGRDGDGGLEVGIVLRKHEMNIFSSLFVGGLEAH